MASTERILYFDCFSGISGDMALAAMIDLGVPEDHLNAELAKLALPGWKLRLSRASKSAIHGTRVDVDLAPVPVAHPARGLRPANSSRAHRSFRDIRELIEAGALSESVKRRAIAIFMKLAEAEAKIHGTGVDEVHFHEVGALDSIIDIVGAAIALDYLAPDKVLCSSVELGGGFVKCQHGLIPVPAPAVLELLRGAPVKSGAVPFETTTPTGAAILASCVDEYPQAPAFSVKKTAYGIGHRDTDIPNVLRLVLAERLSDRSPSGGGAPAKTASVGAESVAASRGVVLECNIDDMNPELHGHLFEVFLDAGADDVWITPILMKKGRPAVTVSVLSSEEREAGLAELLIKETTTFGYRRREVDKIALERSTEAYESAFGPIAIKTTYFGGRPLKFKPEYEDLREAAEASGIPLGELRERVLAEYRNHIKDRA